MLLSINEILSVLGSMSSNFNGACWGRRKLLLTLSLWVFLGVLFFLPPVFFLGSRDSIDCPQISVRATHGGSSLPTVPLMPGRWELLFGILVPGSQCYNRQQRDARQFVGLDGSILKFKLSFSTPVCWFHQAPTLKPPSPGVFPTPPPCLGPHYEEWPLFSSWSE